jgi:hypothetical protein
VARIEDNQQFSRRASADNAPLLVRTLGKAWQTRAF